MLPPLLSKFVASTSEVSRNPIHSYEYLNRSMASPSIYLAESGSGQGGLHNFSANISQGWRAAQDPTGPSGLMIVGVIFLEIVAAGLLFVLLAVVLVRRPQSLSNPLDDDPIEGPQSVKNVPQNIGNDYRDPSDVTEWCPSSKHGANCDCVADLKRKQMLNIDMK